MTPIISPIISFLSYLPFEEGKIYLIFDHAILFKKKKKQTNKNKKNLRLDLFVTH
jgi:hypothetical protein